MKGDVNEGPPATFLAANHNITSLFLCIVVMRESVNEKGEDR
jgi:hypothetical protein